MSGADPRAGQEAARLLQAAQEWLRTAAPHLAPVGPDGTPCSCPVCRTVAGLREADPDSVARWVDAAVTAATSLATQAADLAAAATRSAAPDGPDHDDGSDHHDGSDHDDGPPGTGSDESRDRDPAVDVDAGDDLPDATPRPTSAGQDGPRPRGVRRIPVDREPGAAAH